MMEYKLVNHSPSRIEGSVLRVQGSTHIDFTGYAHHSDRFNGGRHMTLELICPLR